MTSIELVEKLNMVVNRAKALKVVASHNDVTQKPLYMTIDDVDAFYTVEEAMRRLDWLENDRLMRMELNK